MVALSCVLLAGSAAAESYLSMPSEIRYGHAIDPDRSLEGTVRLTRSNVTIPVNIGSDEMVSINGLAHMIADIAGKKIDINHIPGPQGVRGRNSDNRLIKDKLGWAPSQPLKAFTGTMRMRRIRSPPVGGSAMAPTMKMVVKATIIAPAMMAMMRK